MSHQQPKTLEILVRVKGAVGSSFHLARERKQLVQPVANRFTPMASSPFLQRGPRVRGGSLGFADDVARDDQKRAEQQKSSW